MAMNPETNKFEMLKNKELVEKMAALIRPDGTPVPRHWPVFQTGELVVIKDYTFKVAHIGESYILFEPVSSADVRGGDD